jgi:SCY1-like protein 1
MDYLRTLGSAAVSSLVQKSGLNLPFTLGSVVTTFDDASPWTLYEGTKRVRARTLPTRTSISHRSIV